MLASSWLKGGDRLEREWPSGYCSSRCEVAISHQSLWFSIVMLRHSVQVRSYISICLQTDSPSLNQMVEYFSRGNRRLMTDMHTLGKKKKKSKLSPTDCHVPKDMKFVLHIRLMPKGSGEQQRCRALGITGWSKSAAVFGLNPSKSNPNTECQAGMQWIPFS